MNQKSLFSSRVILRFLLVSLALPAVAQAQFTYTAENGGITITYYSGPGGDVAIPGTILGLPVTGIAWHAFADNNTLTNVSIPASLTNIAHQAFVSCHNLEAITVAAGNPAYSSVEGVVFNKNQTSVMLSPEGKSGEFTIPASVTNIGRAAFSRCARLTNVTMNAGVISVGEVAFADCIGLTSFPLSSTVSSIGPGAYQGLTRATSLTIPDSLAEIDSGAFSRCSSLTNVNFGNSLTSIGSYAFQICTKLLNVAIPNSVTNLGEVAFGTCEALTNVTFLGNGVSFIQSGLFASCVSLPRITLPNSVTNIDSYAFNYCVSLTNVIFGNSPFSIGYQSFANCNGLRTLTIPSVTSIAEQAFSNCQNLRSVILGPNLTYVGLGAFFGCGLLEAVYFLGDAPSIGTNPFANSAIYYLPWRAGWSSTFGGRVALPVFGVPIGQFGLNTNWTGGTTVVVEATASLNAPDWLPISTNILTEDASYFFDPQIKSYPARFYRLRSP